MMDYYEELGVDRSASPDEIRQAYKHLVRLLHPDHCSDDRVRPLADLQMKRLNGVLRVLTNPVERELYDRTISGGPSPQGFPPMFPIPIPPAPPAPRTPRWFWAVACGATLLVLFVLLSSTPQSAPRQIVSPEQPGPVSTVAPPKARSRVPGASGVPRLAGSLGVQPLTPVPPQEQFLSTEREVPLPPASPPVVTATDPPVIAAASNTGSSPEPPVAIVPPAAPSLEPARTPPVPRWSGVWLFLPTPQAKTDGLYPPDYIELRLTEQSGILYGRYRARYHIPDQAISPTVSFQFEGRSGPDRASLPWNGAGGAKGEVRLRLLPSGTLEVSWVTNQLSEELGLISGTATLVRKLD